MFSSFLFGFNLILIWLIVFCLQYFAYLKREANLQVFFNAGDVRGKIYLKKWK